MKRYSLFIRVKRTWRRVSARHYNLSKAVHVYHGAIVGYQHFRVPVQIREVRGAAVLPASRIKPLATLAISEARARYSK